MTTDNELTAALDQLEGDSEDLELIEYATIENPDGSVDFEYIGSDEENLAAEPIIDHYENLALYLSEEELQEVSHDVVDAYEEDQNSRLRHIQDLVDGISNLGLSDDEAITPFEGASTVYHPIIMENAVKIQAKAEGELLPAGGPVKTQILGQSTEELEKQARNIKLHMNWQTRKQITEYYSNTQKALLQAALFGDAFKKKYFCPTTGRVKDCLVSIDRLVVNASSENLESAECITEIQYISEREMKARMYSGLYRDDAEVGEPYKLEKEDIGRKVDELLGLTGTGEGYEVLEQHVFLDLPNFEDESGVPLPYIVCVEKVSGEVLSIRRNWHEGRNRMVARSYFTHYYFVPGFGFYNLGYIHLLGNFQMTLTAIMRSLIDAGSFANMPGGFKSKALRILDDGEAVGPGEFRDAEFFGNDISKAIYPFNFKEPSQTLFNLLQYIEARGQKFADSAEQVLDDASNYGPVGTTMALLDASNKFFSTVYKRFHAAQENELKIISELNYENLPDDPEGITFNIPGQEIRIKRADYDERIDIIPVSDPNISSAAHRITLASQKLQSALQAPHVHDIHEAYKNYYIALGDDNYEKLLPPKEEPRPLSPMEDIMAASDSKPIAAFPDQDHEAHIAVKTAFLNDPSVQGNPNFQTLAPAIQANIREHVILRFGEQIEGAQSLGINAKEAAEEIVKYNQHKAQNPLGELDPKQMLAQAEMKKQENEKRSLDIREKDLRTEAALDVAKLQKDIRQQNLEMLKSNIKMKNEEDMAKFKEAIDLVKAALSGKAV